MGSCPRVLQSLTGDTEKRKVGDASLTLQIYRKLFLQLQDEDGRRLGANEEAVVGNKIISKK